MDTPMTRQRFLDTLRAARADWEALLARVDRERMTEPGADEHWTVKDVVAHVTWWEREMVGLAQRRALGGSDLWALELDARNAAIFEQNRDRSLPEVLAEARDVYRQLLAALEALADEDFVDPRGFRGMPSDWVPWQIIADSTYDHYRAHAPSIEAWLARPTKPSE